MEPPRVSPDARYRGAWNEINARIAQRQALLPQRVAAFHAARRRLFCYFTGLRHEDRIPGG
jgi:hypothetical protein